MFKLDLNLVPGIGFAGPLRHGLQAATAHTILVKDTLGQALQLVKPAAVSSIKTDTKVFQCQLMQSDTNDANAVTRVTTQDRREFVNHAEVGRAVLLTHQDDEDLSLTQRSADFIPPEVATIQPLFIDPDLITQPIAQRPKKLQEAAAGDVVRMAVGHEHQTRSPARANPPSCCS